MANSCVVAEAVSADLLALTTWEPGARDACPRFAKDILARIPAVVIVGRI
jgi:hypothetical protein